MSEQLSNNYKQQESKGISNEQSIQLKRDQLVGEIKKSIGEKSVLIYLPLLLGISGAIYGNTFKSEIDKVQTEACKYHEDLAVWSEQHKANGSPDCAINPSDKLIGDSLISGLLGTGITSAIALTTFLSSKKIAKHLIKNDNEN
jgi:hypothetical protein